MSLDDIKKLPHPPLKACVKHGTLGTKCPETNRDLPDIETCNLLCDIKSAYNNCNR